MRREFLLVLVAFVAGCGLIDAINGAGDDDLLCDADGRCSCPNDSDDVSCIGSPCTCGDDGTSDCENPDSVCSVEDADGCFNAACVCAFRNDDGCDCFADAGTCSTTNGTILLDGDGSNESCIGNCACTFDEGCTCLGTDCVFGVDGAQCNITENCRVLQMASDVGCTANRDCEDSDVCGRVADGETGCFSSRACVSDADEVEFTIETVSGEVTTVCVTTLAQAVCVLGQCTDSIPE